MLTVVRAGALTTVQDLGRPGYAHLGVPPSGALDPAALVRANRAVGNEDGAAGLETTLTGVTIRLDETRYVAVAGAAGPVSVDGDPVPAIPFEAPAGATVKIGTATAGLRSYVAIAGGIAVDPVLGSRSTDRLSGLGPAPLRTGDRLPLGPAPAGPEAAGHPEPAATSLLRNPVQRRSRQDGGAGAGAAAGGAGVGGAARSGGLVVRMHEGPRADWLTAGALRALGSAEWTVSRDSDRIGVRLDGPVLQWARSGELPSEGLVTGAVQVPPDGRPVVFLNDHPTTGGYPVVGVADAAALAQARPGSTLRFAVEWLTSRYHGE